LVARMRPSVKLLTALNRGPEKRARTLFFRAKYCDLAAPTSHRFRRCCGCGYGMTSARRYRARLSGARPGTRRVPRKARVG
jgi:hypothetical protein